MYVMLYADGGRCIISKFPSASVFTECDPVVWEDAATHTLESGPPFGPVTLPEIRTPRASVSSSVTRLWSIRSCALSLTAPEFDFEKYSHDPFGAEKSTR